MSKTLQLLHIVFGTRNREKTIVPEHKEKLFRFIWTLSKEKRCKLYRINGMADHIHILIDLHPSVSLADFMRDIKSKTSQWMKKSGYFPQFDGWGEEYFAESKSRDDKDKVIEYIKGQEAHHSNTSLEDELRILFAGNGFDWYDDDLK